MYYKIPMRFQREIMLHIMKNTQEHLLVDGTPSILGVFGPPGEGKTVMCKQILEDVGAFIKVMSVGEFESEDAGKPAERLRIKYDEAKMHLLASPDNISALIIDDADAAFGDWGNDVQYTINTQIIIGELMQIATNEKIRKVPIILTGNDFTKIYYPLRRSGRMNSFYWEPKTEERLDSVRMLFDWLTEDECSEIVKITEQFARSKGLVRPPISFYSSVKGKLVDEELWKRLYEERQANDGLSYINKTVLPDRKYYSSADIIVLCEQELLLIKKGNKNYSRGEFDGENTK